MGRLRAIAIAAAAALATTCSSAAAKEIAAVSICGADGCRAVADERLHALLAEGGLPHRGPGARSEHFVARVRIDHEGAPVHRFETLVVPDAGLARGDDGSWIELSYAAQNAYAKLARGRDPLPASAMPGDAVGEPARASAQPASPSGGGSSASARPWLGAAAAAALALSAAAARRGRRRPAST